MPLLIYWGEVNAFFLEVDKHLIKRLKNNDRKAQLELYNQCFSILMSISYRYKNNEEDAIAIANSSFLKTNTHKNRDKRAKIILIIRYLKSV